MLQICYITTVSPLAGPVFYLRQLLRVLPMRDFSDLLLRPPDAPPAPDGGNHFATYEEAARARGIVVDDNEAALALQEAIALGETPPVLRRMYVTLIRHQPYTKPMQLLAEFLPQLAQDFERGPVNGVPQVQHPYSGWDESDITSLAIADNRRPRPQDGAGTPYNQLLHAISLSLERQGQSMADFELPEPLLGADALPEAEQYLEEFCRGQGAARALQMLRQRAPHIQNVPEQRQFFWDMMRRLRARKGAAEFDERWAHLQQQAVAGGVPPLPDLPDPDAALAGRSDAIFLDAKGGRGKTYVLNAVMAAARLMELPALPCCFTGFAAQDYHGGATCHHLFKIKVEDDLERDPLQPLSSSMPKEGQRAELLQRAHMIIVDECPMAGRRILDTIRKVLQDACGKPQATIEAAKAALLQRWHQDGHHPTAAEREAAFDDIDCTRLPFCGKIVVLAGDFQQTAPVVTRADRGTCAAAWVSRADWWQYDPHSDINHKVFTQSMRAADDPDYDHFVQQVGAGAAPVDPAMDGQLCGENAAFAALGRARRGIRLPESLFGIIHDDASALQHAHPDLTDAKACGRSGVLCTTNQAVDRINAEALRLKVLADPNSPVVELTGITEVKDTKDADVNDGVEPSQDWLNMLDGKGVPPHKLRLCVGAVCMLMRNIAPGWTNGKRVVVKRITQRTVQVCIVFTMSVWHERALSCLDKQSCMLATFMVF